MVGQSRRPSGGALLAGALCLSPLLVFLVVLPVWGIGVAAAGALISLAALAALCCALIAVLGIRRDAPAARAGRDSGSETALIQRRYDRQAALFDFWEAPIEALVFKGLRRRLWGEVTGRSLLEVGVGIGKNLPYHPEGARSVAVDVSPRMLRKAAARGGRLGRDVDLVLADAQRLPFRDGAFGAVAATFVFCSVPDPVIGLREVRRVASDKGKLHLLEHVRARNPIVGKLMDWTNPLWVRFTGANINRDTVSNVEKAGFELRDVETRAFGILKLVRGSVSPGTPLESATADVAHG